jgi:hypothetical protein
MATFAEKCVLAVLGYSALTNYQALVADSYVARQELRQHRGDRTEALILRWQEILPNAEIAAQFFRVHGDPSQQRRRTRRRADAQQMQFFEEQFFATVNFWRVAGADIAVRRVNAGDLSAYLAGDAATWLDLLRQQRGHWDVVREMQIAQAIRSLEIINEYREISNASGWQALDISEPDFDRRGDDIDVSVALTNPNDVDSPVSPLVLIVFLIGGATTLRWPNVSQIPARETITVTITVARSNGGGPIEVRFAHADEL